MDTRILCAGKGLRVPVLLKRVFLLLLGIILLEVLFLLPSPSIHVLAKEKKDIRVSLNLKEVELPVFIKFVSDVTGKSFLFDERVRGKVTVVSPKKIGPDELYRVFLSILDFKGYTALPDGKVIRIVPSKLAKQQGGEVISENVLKAREGFVTRLIPLKFIRVEDVSRIITPLISPNGVISFNADTNTLVVTESSFNINRLVDLVKKLDKKPEVGRLKVFVYYLENARADDISKVLTDLFSKTTRPMPAAQRKGASPPVSITGEITGPISITAENNINALIIRALPQDYDVVKDVIKKLDIRRRQVFVEGAIVEVSLTRLKELGFEFRFLNDFDTETVGGVGGSNFGTIGQATIGPEGLANISGLAVGVVKGTFTFRGEEFLNIGALLKALESESGVDIISTPQLLTTDNQEAEIVVGENVPLITNKTVTTGGNVQTSVERQDVGVRLKLTPHIAEGDFVSLDIYQEISSVSESAAFDPNQVGPLINKRFAQTSVVVKDGETIVIAGLIKDNTTTIVQKVPFLGDVPLLGYLFRYKKDQKDKTNLLIFITPRIVKEASVLQDIRREKERQIKREREEEKKQTK